MARLPLLALLVLTACAPRLSPPYRDYQVRAADGAAVDGALAPRLRQAAEAAGWTLVPALDSAIVTTAPRHVAAGLTSKTAAALDLVPLDGGYVRVYVRAERRSTLFGGRSKVYALDARLRASVLASLTDELRQRGLVPLETPRDRDEDATE